MHKVMKRWAVGTAALGLVMSAVGAASAQTGVLHSPAIDGNGTISEKVIHRSGASELHFGRFQPPAGSTGSSGPIQYHGGPVMQKVSKVVVIWYGNWNQTNGTDTPAGQQIIRDALFGMAASPNASFTNWSGVTTGASSSLGVFAQTGPSGYVTQTSSSTLQEYTYVTKQNLTDAGVFSAVSSVVKSNFDPNAIYLVLSSSDISESSGFLTQYCGWHTYASVGGQAIKYAFIGNPNRALYACAAQTVSPNGNAGVDAMISVIAHELEETVTDPQLNAWYDASGAETGDKCAWTFGSSQTKLASGAYFNVTLPTAAKGTRNYLIQRALAPNSRCYVNATGGKQ